jgi:ATPase family AAA domain-containing protein 2
VLDDRGQVLVIGATNRIDSIDPALRRPGRFDRELPFGLPSERDRLAIFRVHTRRWQPPLCAAFQREVAALTGGYCGADLKALCTEAALRAVRRQLPQLYESDVKLDVRAQLPKLRVSRADFAAAMLALTPASQRQAATPGTALPPHLVPALAPPLAQALVQLRREFGAVLQWLGASEEENERGQQAAAGGGGGGGGGDRGGGKGKGRAGVAAGARLGGREQALTMALDVDEDAELAAVYGGGGGGGGGGGSDGGSDDDDGGRRGGKKPRLSLAALLAAGEMGSAGVSGGMALLGQPASTMHRPRLLVTGPRDCGQIDVARALLANPSVEACACFQLGLPSLLAGHMPAEAALVSRFAEARRAAPAVLFWPDADEWWEAAPESLRFVVEALVADLAPSLPVLLLATASAPHEGALPARLQALLDCAHSSSSLSAASLSFSSSSSAAAAASAAASGSTAGSDKVLRLCAPDPAARRRLLAFLPTAVARLVTPPSESELAAAAAAADLRWKRLQTAAPTLKVAAVSAPRMTAQQRKEAEREAAKRAEHRRMKDEHCLRELFIMLEAILHDCQKEKRFAPFFKVRCAALPAACC